MEENKKDFDESIVEENTSESSAEEQQEEASEKAAGADENAAGDTAGSEEEEESNEPGGKKKKKSVRALEIELKKVKRSLPMSRTNISGLWQSLRMPEREMPKSRAACMISAQRKSLRSCFR